MGTELKRVSKRREITIAEVEKYKKQFKEIQFETINARQDINIIKEEYTAKINELKTEMTKAIRPIYDRLERYEAKMNKMVDEFTDKACQDLDVLRKDVEEITKESFSEED